MIVGTREAKDAPRKHTESTILDSYGLTETETMTTRTIHGNKSIFMLVCGVFVYVFFLITIETPTKLTY